MRQRRAVGALTSLALIAAACGSSRSGGSPDGTAVAAYVAPVVTTRAPFVPRVEEGARLELADIVAFTTQFWPTDWSNSTVDLGEFVLGVSSTEPRDAIPPIDNPVYETPAEAAAWLANREPGALVQLNGDVRFFPLSIMTRHEIVNDEFGGVPLAVTYCPLCNSAATFDRRVEGETLRFGVSGLVRNSDLVMWDDQTVSLWQQTTGEALVGEYAGTRLELVSTAIVNFGDFRSGFPEGRSLSRDTGFEIDYSTTPYDGYSGRFSPLMPVLGKRDERFFPMERVVGVNTDDVDKAYPFSLLTEDRAVNDVVGSTPVVILWGSPDTADALSAKVIANSRSIGTAMALNPVVNGRRLTFMAYDDNFSDVETGSTWTILGMAIEGPLEGTQLETVVHRNDFWFAWTAFFPDAQVYGE
jgi:hypothetical protein